MANAYKCDECEEYHDGPPIEKVYAKVSQRDYTVRAELCGDCSKEFAGGPLDAE